MRIFSPGRALLTLFALCLMEGFGLAVPAVPLDPTPTVSASAVMRVSWKLFEDLI